MSLVMSLVMSLGTSLSLVLLAHYSISDNTLSSITLLVVLLYHSPILSLNSSYNNSDISLLYRYCYVIAPLLVYISVGITLYSYFITRAAILVSMSWFKICWHYYNKCKYTSPPIPLGCVLLINCELICV